MDDFEKYMRALIAKCIANDLEEHAEKVRAELSKYKMIEQEREELQKRLDALSPIMKNYVDKINTSLELSTKLMKGLMMVEDEGLRLFLMNTLNEYMEAITNMQTEFMTLVELRRMDDLERLVGK